MDNNSTTLMFKTIVKELANDPLITKHVKSDKPKRVEDLKFTAAGDMKDQVLSLDLKPVHAVDPGKYKSEKLLEPKNEADRQKYFMIYGEFVTNQLTQKQLAEKHDYSVTHMSRIIKWAATQIGRLDNDSELKVMIDANKMRLQEIIEVKEGLLNQLKKINEEELKVDSDPKKDSKDFSKSRSTIIGDLNKCWKSEMQIHRLISQIEGLMGGALIEVNDNRTMVAQLNSNLDRKSGSELNPGDDATPIGSGEAEEIPAAAVPENNQASIKVDRGDRG
jgi:uncharacterized protein YkvS